MSAKATSIGFGVAAGSAKAGYLFSAAKAVAAVKGLVGAASTSSALASLGGGSIAAGGAGMVGGIKVLVVAASGTGAAAAVTVYAGYKLYENRAAIGTKIQELLDV